MERPFPQFITSENRAERIVVGLDKSTPPAHFLIEKLKGEPLKYERWNSRRVIRAPLSDELRNEKGSPKYH